MLTRLVVCLALALVAGCGDSDPVKTLGQQDAGADAALAQSDAAPPADAPRDTSALDTAVAQDDAGAATKSPGQSCEHDWECLGGAHCVEGEYTRAYCAPLCGTPEECVDNPPGARGMCTGGGFCSYFCGVLGQGALCPGDLVCQGGAACQ
jgi:hypothetical protein